MTTDALPQGGHPPASDDARAIALIGFAVGAVCVLLLAAAPFIYMREGNPYAQAVATYDQMCRARAAGDFQAIRKMLSARTLVISNPDLERHVALWKCPDRAQADLTWEALPHDPAAPGERHHLVITDRADQTVSDTLRFVRESDGMRWDPM